MNKGPNILQQKDMWVPIKIQEVSISEF